jgi:hypothetical protein
MDRVYVTVLLCHITDLIEALVFGPKLTTERRL